MNRGYMGRILWVDLSNGICTEEKIPDEVYEKYLSGMGLAAKILCEAIPPKADPLGPENVLGFVSGLLTGTGSLFFGRWTVVGKSPATGTWGDANCGGTFSPAIKRCGYDGIFIKGISKKPVYLHITNRKAEIRDANDLWGKDTIETEEYLVNLHGKKGKSPRVVAIGPAGEKLSLIAGISNDRGRMAARSGLGAVMGSKKLKAVVCAGSQLIGVQKKEEIRSTAKECSKYITAPVPPMSGKFMAMMGTMQGAMPMGMAQNPAMVRMVMRHWGTTVMNQLAVETGDAPVKNWKGSKKDWPKEKSGSMNPDYIIGREKHKYHCYSCPLGCGGICSMTGKYTESHKPEYETTMAFGAMLLNHDPDSIFYINELLNRAGMDTMSAGGVVAYAIECFENGIITREDIDGLDLSWGNSEAIIALVEKMVAREGVGDILADGVKKAAEKLGKGSTEWAVHGGGSELPYHDGRFDPVSMTHYAAEPNPGKHTIGSSTYWDLFELWKEVKTLPKTDAMFSKKSKYEVTEKAAIKCASMSRFMNVMNGAGGCLFGAQMSVTKVPIFKWLNMATGWGKSPEEYLEIGERIQTMKQLFNIRQGIEPRNIKLTPRAVGLPSLEEGPNKGKSFDIEHMRSLYWIQFGWDPVSGVPEERTLERMEIGAA